MEGTCSGPLGLVNPAAVYHKVKDPTCFGTLDLESKIKLALRLTRTFQSEVSGEFH